MPRHGRPRLPCDAGPPARQWAGQGLARIGGCEVASTASRAPFHKCKPFALTSMRRSHVFSHTFFDRRCSWCQRLRALLCASFSLPLLSLSGMTLSLQPPPGLRWRARCLCCVADSRVWRQRCLPGSEPRSLLRPAIQRSAQCSAARPRPHPRSRRGTCPSQAWAAAAIAERLPAALLALIVLCGRSRFAKFCARERAAKRHSAFEGPQTKSCCNALWGPCLGQGRTKNCHSSSKTKGLLQIAMAGEAPQLR